MFLPHRLKRPITVGIALIFHLFGARAQNADWMRWHGAPSRHAVHPLPVPPGSAYVADFRPEGTRLHQARTARTPPRQDQMTDMNGIECASHNANFSVFFSIRFPQKAPELQRYAPVPAVLSCGLFRKLNFLFLFLPSLYSTIFCRSPVRPGNWCVLPELLRSLLDHRGSSAVH